MGVIVDILNVKFFNEFKNDIGFASNPADTTINLAGSVMENVKVTQDVDVSWDSTASIADEWDLDATALTITRTTGSFIKDGFSVGDIFDWIDYPVGTKLWDATIASISDLKITFVVISGVPASGTVTADGIRGLTPLTALIYTFGLIDNNDNFNVISKVSGNDQGYYGASIGYDTGGGVRSLVAVNMQTLGQYEDWRTSETVADVSMTAAYVSNPSTYVQRFHITHEFTIVPYFIDGELPNLQGNIIPDLLDGLNSLKYVFNAGFRDVLSNPNSQKSEQYEQSLGSVAWFNENFNGFNNDYNIVSVVYEEAVSGDPLTAISISTKTKITITVDRLSGNFSGAERFGAYISYLPEEDEYTNTTTTNLKENYVYDRALNGAGLGAVAGSDFITSCLATVVANDLVIVVEMDYSTAQKQRLAQNLADGNGNYLLGIQVGDNTLTSGNSDRLILTADAREYADSPDIPDLMAFNTFNIFSHDEVIGVDTGSTDKIVWNEEGVAIEFNFELDLNKSAVINTLDFKLLAYNTVTDETFDLDTYSYGVGQAVVSSGVQQLNENTTRGYILESTDQFNKVTLAVGTNAASIQEYDGIFAQKTSWQEWIANLDADSVFFDILEPNDNLNYKSSNYSLKSNYEIRLAVTANVSGISTLNIAGTTAYLFLSPTITAYDYEEDGNITPIWSHVIETFNNSNAAAIGTAVLTGQDTLFRTTWTNSGGAVATLVGIWGINRIEEAEQQGYDITEMSSLNAPAANQLLTPSSGVLLNMYLDSGNVVMECLVDGSLVSSGVDYNLSSEIRDVNAIPPDGKITEAGVMKITEAGDTKIIE